MLPLFEPGGAEMCDRAIVALVDLATVEFRAVFAIVVLDAHRRTTVTLIRPLQSPDSVEVA